MSEDTGPVDVLAGETGAKKLSRLNKLRKAGGVNYAKAKQAVYCVFQKLKP